MKNWTTFNQWWKEVQRLYAEYYEGSNLTREDSADWRDYYDDGYTPKEAIDDEAQYL